ncbi:hypothetical protein L210DRAFT_3575949, partial [Boletus edulis BED1]
MGSNRLLMSCLSQALNTVSQTNLQESTIENERSVVMKGMEYKATDTESGQSNLVVCPPMLRRNDQGMMD